MTIEPTPTKRFVLDPLRPCNYKCKFCYYLHTHDTWKDYNWSWEHTKSVIDMGIARGNNYMDITGGEPTIYKHVTQAIKYALSKGVRSCVITNGSANEKRTDEILDAGIDGWLVSRHGLKDSWNYLTNNSNAYDAQSRFLDQIVWNRHEHLPDMELRFNCVISKFNQNEIFELAKLFAQYKPSIVNFLNFNPHHEWKYKSHSVTEVIANLDVVEPLLNQSIQYLEDKGIGVNTRYYPMCRIADKFRRTICNDLQVMFDPYEWDYWLEYPLEGENSVSKTSSTHLRWGIDTSDNVEEKDFPCNECSIHNVCGGANKYFHKASKERYRETLYPQVLPLAGFDVYYYRKHNIMTLQER
jgi:MoaA/NifB/PqqE/SkfB family radical SAM enzyme